MPRFKKRVRFGDYYVHHCFRNNHLLIHVTYQCTPEATEQILAAGINDGDALPINLFASLVSAGDLYTGQSGATEEIDLSSVQAPLPRLAEPSISVPVAPEPSALPELTPILPTTFTPDLQGPDGRLLRFREFYALYFQHDLKAVRKAYDQLKRSFYQHVQLQVRAVLERRTIYRIEEIGDTLVFY